MVDDVDVGACGPGQLIRTRVQIGGEEHHLFDAGFGSGYEVGVEELCRI